MIGGICHQLNGGRRQGATMGAEEGVQCEYIRQERQDSEVHAQIALRTIIQSQLRSQPTPSRGFERGYTARNMCCCTKRQMNAVSRRAAVFCTNRARVPYVLAIRVEFLLHVHRVTRRSRFILAKQEEIVRFVGVGTRRSEKSPYDAQR